MKEEEETARAYFCEPFFGVPSRTAPPARDSPCPHPPHPALPPRHSRTALRLAARPHPPPPPRPAAAALVPINHRSVSSVVVPYISDVVPRSLPSDVFRPACDPVPPPTPPRPSCESCAPTHPTPALAPRTSLAHPSSPRHSRTARPRFTCMHAADRHRISSSPRRSVPVRPRRLAPPQRYDNNHRSVVVPYYISDVVPRSLPSDVFRPAPPPRSYYELRLNYRRRRSALVRPYERRQNSDTLRFSVRSPAPCFRGGPP